MRPPTHLANSFIVSEKTGFRDAQLRAKILALVVRYLVHTGYFSSLNVQGLSEVILCIHD